MRDWRTFRKRSNLHIDWSPAASSRIKTSLAIVPKIYEKQKLNGADDLSRSPIASKILNATEQVIQRCKTQHQKRRLRCFNLKSIQIQNKGH